MRGNLVIALVLAAMLGVPATQAFAEPTREEYVSQVDPICQANTEANERILKNVRQKARNGKLQEAGGQFIRASAAFGATVRKITEVPRPAADDARLVKWFKYLGIVAENLRKVGKALKEGDKILAAHEGIRVERSANAANNVGFVFEFHYCHITPGRFS